MSQKKRWTIKEIQRLLDMSNSSASNREIAMALGRSFIAVKNKKISINSDYYTGDIVSIRKEKILPSRVEMFGDGHYAAAARILKHRHRYDKRLGNFVDGRRVSVQEMMRIAGFKMGE